MAPTSGHIGADYDRNGRHRKDRQKKEADRTERITNRVIAYYEQDGAQPPGPLLVDLARTLGVTTHELLGMEPLREKITPKQARIRKRLQRVEELPAADQRAVLKFVDALVESRGVDNGS